MKIVTTPTPKRQQVDLDYLATHKAELSDQIHTQQKKIADSAKHLLLPASSSVYFLKAFNNKLNMIDGVLIGYKIVRSIRRVFRK